MAVHLCVPTTASSLTTMYLNYGHYVR
jgi:hypothetical protein